MQGFLRATDVIDWEHPAVLAKARELRRDLRDEVEIAARAYAWVRDEVRHSTDHGLTPVPSTASEVLACGSGFCYAKSHLLAALLRANRIPAGFCYQRLALDEHGRQFCLHGLNAIFLPGVGWYRVDARGNRDDIRAAFAPPVERLAFEATRPGELDLPEIWPDPLTVVVEALRSHDSAPVLAEQLPDIPLWGP